MIRDLPKKKLLTWKIFIFLSLFPLVALSSSMDEYKPTNAIHLQGLDKITARVFEIKAKINKTIRFGNLLIYVTRCIKAPPEERPESMCFLRIVEEKLQAHKLSEVFTGWMFASNPALSTFDHPVYDIWVKEAMDL